MDNSTKKTETAALKQDMLVNKLRDVLGRMEIATMMASDAMVWTDGRGRVQWCNNAFEDLIGQSRVELLGSGLVQAFPLRLDGEPLPSDRHPAVLGLALQDHDVVRAGFLGADGLVNLEIDVAPTNPGGSPSSVVLVIRRIEEPLLNLPEDKIAAATAEKIEALAAENRRLAGEVAELSGRLANKEKESEEFFAAGYRTKSAFLANMTHELRTPLSAIMGYADLLNRDLLARGHAAWAGDVAQIRKASDRLFFTITQLLDLAAIEEDQFDVRPVRFNLHALLQDVERVAREYMGEQNNRLTVTVEPGLADLRNDEAKLRKGLLQLLSNAAKFTVEGNVTLDVRAAGDDLVAFVVGDSGMGMTREQQARIFEPFTQGDETLTRKFEGGGVGLYIARQFFTVMGGDITVESTPGGGATFTATIARNVGD